MRWLQRLLGARTSSAVSSAPAAHSGVPAVPAQTAAPGAAPAAAREQVFSRRTPNPQAAPPGQERATFLAKVAPVFGEGAGPLDAAKALQDGGYGCDELDVSELVQIAEEVWAVQLNPNPMRMSDFEAMLRRFPTLEAIMSEAEGVAAERRARS